MLVRRSQLTLGVVAAVTGLMALGACAQPLPQPLAQSQGDVAEFEGSLRSGAANGSRPKKSQVDERSARVLGSIGAAFGASERGERNDADATLNRLIRGVAAAHQPVLCPADMSAVDDRFCVDRFEASIVEVLPNGEERSFSPYATIDGRTVRAVSQRGVVPQAYISGREAAQACARSGKRLCKPAEWRQACMGPSKKTWGYGETRQRGRCNDNGRSAMGTLYGQGRDGDRGYWNMDRMNNPELNQVAGTVAKTGDHESCTNEYGVYDMVGNVHEWVDDPGGTFQGGYYLDVTQNGDGCGYKTRAHENWYHDYSTGFRCCADIEL